LLSTLFLELTCGKDHVNSTALSSETALTFRKKMALFEVMKKTVEKDTGQDLSSYGQE